MKGQPTEIWKIYNQANSTLEIPVYQRNYDWKTKQCARLFDDLEALAEADPEKQPKHFFGAVVGKNEGNWKWIVIDGQQRLTTISLLILAIAHSLEAGEIEAGENPGILRKLVDNYLLVDANPNDLKFKLKPVKNDAAAYRALFRSEEEFIDSSNVTANYRYFRDRLLKTNLTGTQMWDAVTRLEVMHLDLESHDDPQGIFESLNSTGLNLSEADKIRNFVLMNQKLDEQNRLYEQFWNPIEKNVDYRTDWFIRWYLTSRTRRTPKESEVFEAFKIFVKNSKDTVPEILEEMHAYSKSSHEITHAESKYPTVNRRLRRANLIIGDVVHPFLMPVFGEARKGEITEQDLDQVIKIIECYIFRRTVCQVGTNALNKIFATAYNELRKLRTHGQSYADLLTWIIRRRDGGSGRFPGDSDFRVGLQTRDFYHLPATTRQYIFDVLENGDSKDNRDIADRIASGELTVEHIMPQTLNHAWEVELGPQAAEVHEVWKNRIGNLTVTGYNSSYSNSPFKKKMEMQNGFSSSPYRLNSDVKTAETWTEDAMRSRTERLAEQAMDYWQLIETDFRPPEVVRPTEPLGDDASFRGKVITGYTYEDVSETVTDWASMLPKLLGVLLEQDRSGLLRFAETESLLTTNPASHSEERGLRTVDPSLGVWVSSNTKTKINLLRRLFAALNLDTEELIFTFRPSQTDAVGAGENETPTDEPSGPYASLTKFIDGVNEAKGVAQNAEETSELRDEFTREFAPFRVDNWMAELDNQPLAKAMSETPASQMTAEKILAVITGILTSEEMFGPGALHAAIMDSSLSEYLNQLNKLR